MQTAIRIRTTVLPGHRIEFSNPQLAEGSAVDVVVTPSEPSARQSLGRREMLRMPLEQRRKVLEQQSERMASHYEPSEERTAWQGGDIFE